MGFVKDHQENDAIFYGNTITYECHSGYFLVGHKTAYCQSNGLLNNMPPFCEGT